MNQTQGRAKHPRGNFWFVSELEKGDEFFDAEKATWGVFLQIPGAVAPIGLGFYKPEDAEAFIREDILGAPLDPACDDADAEDPQ